MLLSMEKHSQSLEELQNRLKKTIGNRIAQARSDMNYSQLDLLAELERYGMARTQGSISQIENGKRLPSIEALYIIVRFLNTSVDYVMGLSENAQSPADMEEELAAARGEGWLNKAMIDLSKERQQQLQDYAEYLLSLDRQAQEDAQALESLLSVYERKHGRTATEELLEAAAQLSPRWKLLLDRRASASTPKQSFIQKR